MFYTTVHRLDHTRATRLRDTPPRQFCMPPMRLDVCLRCMSAKASKTWLGSNGCRALGGGANSDRGCGCLLNRRTSSMPPGVASSDLSSISCLARLDGEGSPVATALRLVGDAFAVFRSTTGAVSIRSRTSRAVTQSERTISKARKPKISTMSSFGRTSKYAPKLMKSRNRRAIMSAESALAYLSDM